jgi:hypothetical protein
VDLAFDETHCGNCATSCRSGESCALGSCRCPAWADLLRRNGLVRQPVRRFDQLRRVRQRLTKLPCQGIVVMPTSHSPFYCRPSAFVAKLREAVVASGT